VIPNCLANCAVFKVRRGARRGDSAAWSLKTQQRGCRSTRPGPVDIPRIAGARGARRALREELPRKEVIQPHLPVRLPCYDFTPITGPTFDGSLP
jgi:hypothetical protein